MEDVNYVTVLASIVMVKVLIIVYLALPLSSWKIILVKLVVEMEHMVQLKE